jgi:hypothetical protein
LECEQACDKPVIREEGFKPRVCFKFVGTDKRKYARFLLMKKFVVIIAPVLLASSRAHSKVQHQLDARQGSEHQRSEHRKSRENSKNN